MSYLGSPLLSLVRTESAFYLPCLGSLLHSSLNRFLKCTLYLTLFHGINIRICKLLALFALVFHEYGFPPRASLRIPEDRLDFIVTTGNGFEGWCEALESNE